MVYITFYRLDPKFGVSLSGCWLTPYTHLKSRQIAVGLIYSHIFIQHKQPQHYRLNCGKNYCINSMYNYWFHHETDFLSFSTLVQYQLVGLTQYLISHHPSISYVEDRPNTFFRNFGIYLTIGCHTEGGNILIDHSNKRNTSIDFCECNFFPVCLI